MNIACISFTDKGYELGEKLESLELDKYKIKHYSNKSIDGGVKAILESIWIKYDGIIFISATGIAFRMLAPFVKDKTIDPAVLVIDDLGKFSISLLSGHIGGANSLAIDIANIIGAIPVITTATDNRNIESIDMFAKDNNYHIENIDSLTSVVSMMVNGKEVGIYTEDNKIIDYKNISIVKDLNNIEPRLEALIVVSSKIQALKLEIPYTILRPKNINIGIGCRKAVEASRIIYAIEEKLEELSLCKNSIKAIGTVEVKKDERGIIQSAKHFKCPLKIFSIDQIKEVEENFSKSQFVKDTIGVYSVSEPVAFLLGGEILSGKSKHDGITISISKERKDG